MSSTHQRPQWRALELSNDVPTEGKTILQKTGATPEHLLDATIDLAQLEQAALKANSATCSLFSPKSDLSYGSATRYPAFLTSNALGSQIKPVQPPSVYATFDPQRFDFEANSAPWLSLPSSVLHETHYESPSPARSLLYSTFSISNALGTQTTGATPEHFLGATISAQRPASKTNSASWFSSGSHSHLSTPPPEAMLQDLTEYITKDEEYPAARGGFGEIWKCTCRMDQREMKVAVKALIVYSTDQFGEAREKKMKRIRRELRTWARLEHSHILPLCGYTFGFGPLIAIVSPWAENGNLTAYLEHSGAVLTVVRRFQILKDVTHGLQYLHTNNVIHADLNGPNVLIYGDGTACLADFGLSLMYSELANISQASSTLKGNVRWMAPELLGEREDGSSVRPSKQSDIYSFGGIMLQVLTNRIPYYHLSRDPAIIRCIITFKKPSRSQYPAIPDKYWHVIDECWSADPQERPSTERVVDVIKDERDFLSILIDEHRSSSSTSLN